jgi:hypothetical protein
MSSRDALCRVGFSSGVGRFKIIREGVAFEYREAATVVILMWIADDFDAEVACGAEAAP